MKKQKPKLLLLHGALGSADQMKGIGRRLKRLFDVEYFTFRGHGGIPTNSLFSTKQFAEEVIAYIESNGATPRLIFGYSMGGYVGLEVALMKPEYVTAIVTLGTKFAWNPASAEQEIQMLQPDKIEEKVPAFAEKLKEMHGSADWKSVMLQTADMMFRMGAGESLKSADFKRVTQPVILGIGDADAMVSIEETSAVHNMIPQASLKILPSVKHPIDQVNLALLEAYIVGSFKNLV